MFNRSTRTVLAALLTTLLAWSMIGCDGGSDDGSAVDAKYEVGFLMTLDHPYWQNLRLGSIDEGKKLGVSVTVENAKEDPALQISQIQAMIAKKVDAVCLVPMKKQPLKVGVEMLNKAGIPVIIVNRAVADGADYVCYVGTDTYQGAETSARILCEKMKADGQTEIVEFHQDLGSDPELARSKAIRDVIKEYPEMKIVQRIPHKGDRAEVIKQMQVILLNYPDLGGVYAHGDMFAIAAAQACRQQDRKNIKSVGMGGSKEAIQAIKDGLLTGSSFQQPEQEGRRGIRLAFEHLEGKEVEDDYIPCPPITKENADQYEGQF